MRVKFDEICRVCGHFNLVLVAWLYKDTISFIHICMSGLRAVSSLYCTNLSCIQDSDGSSGIGLSGDGSGGIGLPGDGSSGIGLSGDGGDGRDGIGQPGVGHDGTVIVRPC